MTRSQRWRIEAWGWAVGVTVAPVIPDAFEQVGRRVAALGSRVRLPGWTTGVLAAAMLLGAGSRIPTPPGNEWLFLRNGLPPQPEEHLVEVFAVGDVMPGRGMANVDDVFAEVAGELQGADLAIANLEGAVGVEPAPIAGIPLLLAPETTRSLAEAGFDLVSLANNHSLDAGAQGLVQTRRQLLQAGIEPIEGERPVVTEIQGKSLAFVGWNDLGLPSEDKLQEMVREAEAADIVIVLIHWGQEYQRQPILRQRELGRALLEAGADVVLGSHPHVVQSLEIVEPDPAGGRARLVAYSLGNFVFDQGWDDTGHGLALRLLFDQDGLRAAQALPLWTAPRPHWMSADETASVIDRLRPPARQRLACSQEECWASPAAPDTRSGILRSGSVDLTGDGVKEIVRRTGAAVEIAEEGKTVWRSPPEWRVRDLALGDPNDDGRYELMLAVEQTATDGQVSSHPFLLGHRGGLYRLLWGGSAVQSPILEVEIGDWTGDGADELVVIEASADGTDRCVTVWRWHGWGFSLVWRSPPGDYRDLILQASGDDSPAAFSVAVGG